MKVIDKIRSLSEDEFVEVIYGIDALSHEGLGGRFERFCESQCKKNEEGDIECVFKGNCKGCIREWLNTEYEE